MDRRPSSEWTDADRLIVVAQIGEEIHSAAIRGGAFREELLAWSDRLSFLAAASEKFLENNRKQILGEGDE